MGGVPAQLMPNNPESLPSRKRGRRHPRQLIRAGAQPNLSRNRRVFPLSELNQAIAELVGDLNAGPMRRLGVSHRDLFLELDRSALKPLPAEPYDYAEWRVRRVAPDYHVDIDRHYYSVPYRLTGEQLDGRVTSHTVELFRKSSPLRRRYARIPGGRPRLSDEPGKDKDPCRLVGFAPKVKQAVRIDGTLAKTATGWVFTVAGVTP